jgi:hypothetical protein
MDEYHLKKIDESQLEMTNDLYRRIRFYPSWALRWETEKLIGKEAYTATYGEEATTTVSSREINVLANFLPFFHKVFMMICPYCEVVAKPSELIPYLERGYLIPVLTSGHAAYPRPFVDTIKAFTYVPSAFYVFLLYSRMLLRERGLFQPHFCPACYQETYRDTERILSKLTLPEDEKTFLLKKFLPYISIPSRFHEAILMNFRDSLSRNELESIDSYMAIITGVYRFQETIGLSSVPTIHSDTLEATLSAYSRLYKTHDSTVVPIDLVNEAATRLSIEYSPEMPIADYMKILDPHIGSCSSIFKDIPEEKLYASVLSRANDISEEVRKATRSKRKNLLKFSAAAVSANPTLLSMLIGGGIGFLNAGPVGCGIGSGILGAISAIIKRTASLKLPPEALKELEEFIKPLSITAMAKYYGIRQESATVWSIREKLQMLPRKMSPGKGIFIIEE